jgi:hypothetical protein
LEFAFVDALDVLQIAEEPCGWGGMNNCPVRLWLAARAQRVWRKLLAKGWLAFFNGEGCRAPQQFHFNSKALYIDYYKIQ